MTVIGESSHALFFNGVSDSILCPSASLTSTSVEVSVGDSRSSHPLVGPSSSTNTTSGLGSFLGPFTVEAWVRPDCGGIIASKEGLFELSMGSVGSPAPATFQVTLHSDDGVPTVYKASTAEWDASNSAYVGIVYPTKNDSFLANNTDIDSRTRELLHVSGVFDSERISLLVNGDLVASVKIPSQSHSRHNDKPLFIGGEGGQYRGFIEGFHWKSGGNTSDRQTEAFIKSSSTLGLWRFEEPVEIDETLYHIKSNVSAGATTLTLDTTQVQTLYESISGLSTAMPTTYNVPSLGDYQVAVTTHSGGAQKVKVPHTIANLLINPTSTDIETGKPNSKPPERVRLKTINSDGTIVVDSIHLDFDISSDTGSRGVLHARTAFNTTNNLANDSTMVLLKSDLLLDEGTGQPMQPPGLGAQAIDRNGMTVIDEGPLEQHGFLFSRRLSINEAGNPYTISNANWAIDTKFQAGHSGRHFYSHVTGHEYNNVYPLPTEEIITQNMDGISDSFEVHFTNNVSGMTTQVPINSQVSLYRETMPARPMTVLTSSKATSVARNGMVSLSAGKDEIIAIGGSTFDIRPFLLKGHAHEGVVQTDDSYELHLIPETEPRIAILETGDADFPYVEIHYNGIDLTGDTMGTGGPCLLVEKTVPSGGSLINSKRVAATIASSISSGRKVHSPGGLLTLSMNEANTFSSVMKSHYLVGDNTGGNQNELVLDYSTTTNYSPSTSTDAPKSPPKAVVSTHVDQPVHPSRYHKVLIRPHVSKKSSDDLLTDDTYRMKPASGTTGPTSQSSHLYETFDIIDNVLTGSEYHLYLQPSNRARAMQLAKTATMVSATSDITRFTIEYLQSRGRVSSFSIESGQAGEYVKMEGFGLMDDIAGVKADVFARGSADSQIVKEMKPDAPVVSVTLGGPGQGAIETIPTWDKSPLSRAGWSTAKAGAVEVSTVGNTNTIVVQPLNNNSTALASWATYMFPARGRLYIADATGVATGASAEYKSRDGTTFTLWPSTGHEGFSRYTNNNGHDEDSFTDWKTNTGIKPGHKILLDPLFDEASIAADGTTLNDRLFQSIGSVNHDYQLGTQYASTRALVEIPVFSNQFFDDPDNSVFPGPDNSMKIHLDPTLTAHTWAPNPVGRRPAGRAPIDREALGPYEVAYKSDRPSKGVPLLERAASLLTVNSVSTEFNVDTANDNFYKTYTNFRNISTALVIYPRLYLPSDEWVQISDIHETNNTLTVLVRSAKFYSSALVDSTVTVGPRPEPTLTPMFDDTSMSTTVNEFRRPYYYDRSNVQTQGGNLDYGLRQYVSAVEFKAGPTANPHAERIESGCATFEITDISAGQSAVVYSGPNFPRLTNSSLYANYTMRAINQDNEVIHFTLHADADKIIVDVSGGKPSAAVGDVFTFKAAVSPGGFDLSGYDGYQSDGQSFLNLLNKTWNHPYAPGGLRHGDTVWMNMHYTNPHAIEGLFCKSRGVYNEFLVWNGFNGGRGELGDESRDSIPLENFLIGDTCVETARNFVQHVNKTIELNWLELGYSDEKIPVVAYLDPYLAEDGHARILLYDVAHDREFISFHDLHMQVQTSQSTPKVEGLDVANGFRSQIKDKGLSGVEKSSFMEGAYAHQASPYLRVTAADSNTGGSLYLTPNEIDYGSAYTNQGLLFARTDNTTSGSGPATVRHGISGKAEGLTRPSQYSTFFDTPDGTRAIPAFLCLKGIRSESLDLASHAETRLQNLPHWTDMDFVRRLTIDLGQVAQSEAVTDVESAANEIVRRINQAAALQARSESGSIHDPAPFWDDSAFSGGMGSHMGYLRAHIGRSVTDLDGVDGFTVVIHSTVPGASGRNFCAWLDNSKGQSPYRPQFLVGHGGRFRNFWCMPTEGEDENMHAAPMPITKTGRPFAPITTLRQLVPSEEEDEELTNNLAEPERANSAVNSEMATGRAANTIYSESLESQGDQTRIVEGLRTGTTASARINFGGLVASGVPGWAPDAGKFGFGPTDKAGRFNQVYGTDTQSYSNYVTVAESSSNTVGDGELYGFRFTDHRGKDHTIRLIYREAGKPFANANTVLPPNIESEIIISFDDRDVSRGGFTIGKHMAGTDTYPFPGSSAAVSNTSWRGNTWSGVMGSRSGYPVHTAAGTTSFTVTFDHGALSGTDQIPTGTADFDYLGHLGFPDEGLFIWSDNRSSNKKSKVYRYASRTRNASASGTHIFYGVTGGDADDATPNITNLDTPASKFAMISPVLNWTTLVTDELIAAAVEEAINLTDLSDISTLDCSEMYAPDGRTYNEWLGDSAQTAVKIHTLKADADITPLSTYFSATTSMDWGLYSGNAELGNTKGGLSSTQIDAGVLHDVGYLPRTVLEISTKFKGTNANTVTPVLIDSGGNAVSTAEWRKNLRGEKYRCYPGDHITPAINNPIIRAEKANTFVGHYPTGFFIQGAPWYYAPHVPFRNLHENRSFGHTFPLYDESGKQFSVYMGGVVVDDTFTFTGNTTDNSYTITNLSFNPTEVNGLVVGTPITGSGIPNGSTVTLHSDSSVTLNQQATDDGTNITLTASTTYNKIILAVAGDEDSYTYPADGAIVYLSGWTGERARLFAGHRLTGNTYGEPISYFRGGQDSQDHYIPLYFGGGFSGAVMDINDGTQNDYSEFYSHPYATGPTGCSGLQHVGENMGSHALLDTTAMLAMFPGTPYLNQHRGEPHPPFSNADAMLVPDSKVGTETNDAGLTSPSDVYGSALTATTMTHPIPIVLRFAHPYARYSANAQGSSEEVAYVVFGPGQSVPKHFHGYKTASLGEVEPASVKTVSNKHTHVYGTSTVRQSGTENGKYFPNELSKGHLDSNGDYINRAGNYLPYLPPTMEYQRSTRYPYSILRNWEPAYGSPSSWFNKDFTSSSALLLSNHWATVGSDTSKVASLKIAHPMDTVGTTAYEWRWHMDGGYPAGGNPFDNAVRKNPPHPTSGAVLPHTRTTDVGSDTVTLGLNCSMFRVGSLALADYDPDLTEANTARDVFVVDATRVQNSEELGAVISAAINSFPGEGNLKSLGGTFLPSFQEAIRQDRYSWVDVGTLKANGYGHTVNTVDVDSLLPNSLPTKGWIRLVSGTNSYYGKYVSYVENYNSTGKGRFTLGDNFRFEDPRLEQPDVTATSYPTISLSDGYTVYVWSKAGNLRWSNGAPEDLHDPPSGSNIQNSVYDHLAATQVHFNGFTDAMDRTRPVGAVGWHGERYSLLNSLKVEKKVGSTYGVSSGLGAWHPMLGFNPYGAGMGCHAMNGAPYTVAPGTGSWAPDSNGIMSGLHPRHYVVVSYEAELPIIAKADRDGLILCGDMLDKRWNGGVGGTVISSHNKRHNNDRFAAYAHGGPHVDAQYAYNTDATVAFTPPSAFETFTANTHSSTDPTILKVVSSTVGLVNGMALAGTGIPSGTTIVGFDASASTVTMSASANATNSGVTVSAGTIATGEWSANKISTTSLFPMESCLFPTGDLFFDQKENPGVAYYPSNTSIEFMAHDTIDSDTYDTQADTLTSPYNFWKTNSAARNFFVNHVVWKRMDGGNLCMPSSNARGLGAVPWVWRKVGSSYVKFGEKLYGNTRFSFETTNAAMFPTIQAQELTQPQLADKYPVDVSSALNIPNEEMQFMEIEVVDDTGQPHVIEGGSPLGTVIRDFARVPDRDVAGPALAGSGNEPNLKIRLPDSNTIPGNIVVRSGYDKVQAYQHESIGTGGLQRPDLPDPVVKSNFDSANTNPSTEPFYENEGWERIDARKDKDHESRSGSLSSDAPLQTSYEPHDRALYFHLTNMGWSYTEREPLGIINNDMTHNPLTLLSVSGSVVTVNEDTIEATIWQAEQLPDGRSFFTVNGHVVSFTGISGSTFTGCKYTPGFSASASDVLKPSFYVPAGSTRHFAARRLRDHAEISGESPDKAMIDWKSVGSGSSPATVIRTNRLTPMPLPRMGHHYVTPTMAVMPGHLSHPLYQRVYNLNRAYTSVTMSMEEALGYTDIAHSNLTDTDAGLLGKDGVGINNLTWFSTTSSPHPPSDIHGGAFTLMFETKVKYDGYGILAFDDDNNDGDHRLKLESGTNYSTHWNFPDPLESGAYQIVIQPNLFAQQLMGFNSNKKINFTTGNEYPLLTSQQVVTVIALEWNGSSFDFILSEKLPVDVRGCEVYLNELMLDVDPSPTEQFTSLPPLALYNPLGVNESTSPAFSRKTLPYNPNMTRLATPGYTLTVPWWSPALKTVDGNGSLSATTNQGAHAATNNWRKLEHYYPEDYFHYCRTGYGAVAAQTVLHGYPTHFLDSTLHSYSSLNPTCEVTSFDSGGWIIVDNNDLFPEVGKQHFGHKLEVIATDGSIETANYSYRGPTSSGGSGTTSNKFYDITDVTAGFWAALVIPDGDEPGTTIRLTGQYSTLGPGKVYTDRTASMAAYHTEQVEGGTEDTNTGHLADAYLSMWHYNLGRPMTYYSDSRTNIGDAAVDKKPYNHMPEHYETMRYNDFSYVVSDGPFDFRAFGLDNISTTGYLVDPNNMDLTPQSRTVTVNGQTAKFHYGSFWPGGSRFGAQASRMDAWGVAGPGWGRNWDYHYIYQHDNGNSGLSSTNPTTITDSISSKNTKRHASFGYRFSVKAPFNKPRAALWSTQASLDGRVGFLPGPYVQNDSRTTTTYVSTNPTYRVTNTSYSGIVERITNASALVGSDLKGQQVRYSHGRRMTRPFGCAVRNFVNQPMALRDHQGDHMAGTAARNARINTNRRDLAQAVAHYMVDWWGNTTGEDVRRAPVRGFGIRPAWDPEDAYSSTDRTKNAIVLDTPDQHGHARATLDPFDPGTAKRVGDRGDGRGVRCPTAFNEDMLQEVDTIMDASGIVLSTHTAEPSLGRGYVRPRDDDLQAGELIPGISRVLEVEASDGLLKPEAMVGSNIDHEKESLLPANQRIMEPVSRSSPRIGLDAITVGSTDNTNPAEYVIVSTEAHSLHTDRAAGRRYMLAGGVRTYNRALSDYDLTSLDFSDTSNNNVQVMRLNYTHGIWPLGGNLIMDVQNYVEPVSDKGWGTHGQERHAHYHTANPYETNSHDAATSRTNFTDKSIKLLVRPVRVLDARHLEIFRKQTNALSATAAGRYGVFLYDAPTARATATNSLYIRSTVPNPTNPPYPPVYHFLADGWTDDSGASPVIPSNNALKNYLTPVSVGPKIAGYESTSFSNAITQTVARLVVADNTLQHLRSDNLRQGDYSVPPRYSQSLKSGTNLNKSDHSGESSHSDNRVGS
jgi:hypothetical protein